MTKTFWYDEKHWFDLGDDFDYFFENFKEEVFDTPLTHSFEVVVMNNKINAIRCSIADNEASFQIWWADCFTRPAGRATVTCVTELLLEFNDRIDHPEYFKNTEEARWEN